MYISFEKFTTLYDNIDEELFNRLQFDAERMIDNHTTGLDGVKKLRVAFPAEKYDADAVMYCTGNLVNLLYQLHKAEQALNAASGYTETENGLHRKVISQMQSGSESITFSEAKLSNSSIDAALADKTIRDEMIVSTIREYLSGIKDANGVNLLYMGRYPRV